MEEKITYDLILTDYIQFTAQNNLSFEEMENYLIEQLTLSDYKNKNTYDSKKVSYLEGGIITNNKTGETIDYFNFSKTVREVYDKYRRLYYSFLYE